VSGYLDRPAPSGLADVIEVILDKGIVIDAYVRVSLLGIELLTVDARVVIASVDTYLRFAEATNRLELEDKERGLPELIGDVGGRVIEDVAEKVVAEKVGRPVRKVKGAVTEAKDKVEEAVDKAADVVQDKLT
jgi:gas vesicle structural protein